MTDKGESMKEDLEVKTQKVLVATDRFFSEHKVIFEYLGKKGEVASCGRFMYSMKDNSGEEWFPSTLFGPHSAFESIERKFWCNAILGLDDINDLYCDLTWGKYRQLYFVEITKQEKQKLQPENSGKLSEKFRQIATLFNEIADEMENV